VPQFPVTNMAIAPIAEEAKILRIKGLGIGTEEVGPNFRHSFYAVGVSRTLSVHPKEEENDVKEKEAVEG
jgi:hypothetical protein